MLADDSAASSVHLADFPEPRQAEIDPALEHRMALARTIVSTTLALRNTHKLNVRQPLAQVSVVLEPGVEREAIEQVRDLILDEVNVEALDYVDGRSELIQRTVKPNFRVLGKRAGKQMKQLAGLIQQLDEAQINAAADGQPITVELGGQAFELAGDDLIIETQGAEGWAALREGGITVAVDTTMTPELRAKGLAREVINRIQNLRKQADFAVTDRIRVRWQADGVLAEALEAHGDWIARETLATELASGDVDAAISESFDLDGAILTLHVTRL